MPPTRSHGLHPAGPRASDSLSSISNGLSSSSASETIRAASKQPTGKPGTGKAFVPPKIVPAKKFQKRQLPKRTPLPDAAHPDAATKKGPLQREEQLAALQSQLMMSRANIGKRWETAWKSAGSSQSAVSIGSDFDSLDDLDSSDFSSERTSFGEKPLGRRSTNGSSANGAQFSDDALTTSATRRDIMALLEREMSSDFEEIQDESGRSLNLTSSGFIEDLALDLVAQPSGISPSPPAKDIMPRPLQNLKLRLFQGSGQDSSASISSVESTTPPAVWRLLPSRETSVPEEQEESVEETEGDEEEEEEEQSEEEPSEVGETEEEEEEVASSTVSTLSAEQVPQLRWEMEQVEEEEEKEPPFTTAPSPKVVRRPLRAADMKVDERVEEDACQEDFARREMADRILYEYTGDPLTPKIDKLLEERIRLAEWAKRLRADEQADGDKPVAYRPPLVPPPLKDVGSTFPRTEVDRPLTADISARGDGIEARLGQKALLPSTRVWQLEQRAHRLQRHSTQQRKHLRVLQEALRGKTTPDPTSADTRVHKSSLGSESVSPRTAELKLYEEQCIYLGAQLNEEHEFCDTYRQQLNRALLKNVALKKRHENAVEAIKHHKLIQEQQHAKQVAAEEQLVDLKDQVDREITKRAIETSSRQQREEQALSLQERYAQLVHYLQETEEKRSAYEDGLRTAQSNAQKAAALLQVKEVEIAYAKHYMETQDTQMLEKEVLRRKERDRANLAERQIEQLNGSITAKDVQIVGLMEKVSDGVVQLQQEQQQHEKTREALQEAQKTLHIREAEIKELQSQINEQRKTTSGAQQKLAALEKLASDFEAFAGKAKDDEADMEAWRDELEARRAKALAILQTAERSAIAVLSQLDDQGVEEQALNALAQQVEALRSAREQELSVHEEEFKKLSEERHVAENQLEEKAAEIKRLQQEVDTLNSEIKREAMRVKCATRRVIRSMPAYGRRSEHPLSKELRTMRIGSPLEMLVKSGNRRPDLRYLKMFKNGIVMWTEDLSGKKAYKKADHFAARDIIGIDFGSSSSAYLWAVKRAEGGKSPEQHAFPWRCFTVRTMTGTYEFRAKSDDVAQEPVVDGIVLLDNGLAQGWVIGLGRLSAVATAPMITNRRELIVHRVRMKLDTYANQRGVPPAVIWKEAINRTLAQLPHIRQRAAERIRKEPLRQQKNESESRRRSPLKVVSQEELPQRGGQPANKRGRRTSQMPEPSAGTHEEKGRRRGAASPAPEKHLEAAPDSPTERHRRPSADPKAERRSGSPKSAEGHRSAGKEGGAAKQRRADSDKQEHPMSQTEADEQYLDAPKKKGSKGILSRAGSIFKRTTTGASRKQTAT